MVPLILITTNKVSGNAYIKRFVKEMKVGESYITTIEKDGASLKIDSIRTLSEMFARTTTDVRVVIIHDFETARNETQNAMLKILEEKTGSIQFIIVCRDRSAILSTIASRCKIIKLAPTKTGDDLVDLGEIYSQIFPTTDKIKSEKVLVYIDKFIESCRSKLRYAIILKDIPLSERYLTFMKACLECRYLLNHNNLNAQMVIDHLLITFNSLET